jgi:hypothetical protein
VRIAAQRARLNRAGTIIAGIASMSRATMIAGMAARPRLLTMAGTARSRHFLRKVSGPPPKIKSGVRFIAAEYNQRPGG